MPLQDSFTRRWFTRLDMRRVPFLTFHMDTTIEDGATVLAHLDEVLQKTNPEPKHG